MAADDVPLPEMPLRATPDPVDAALRGEPVDDPAIEALVHDLRAACLPEDVRVRSAALVAFAGPATGAGDPAVEPRRSLPVEAAPVEAVPVPSRGRRARVAVAAFAATLAGKVVLGGAIAAATVGGLHATEVVDVPLLPDVDRRPPVADPTPGEGELPAPDAGARDADPGTDVAPAPAGDAGTARTDPPETSGATDSPAEGRPGAAPDAAGDAGSAPPPVAPPTTAGPPHPAATTPRPGSSADAGAPTTTPAPAAEAGPPTTATRSQGSRNIP